MIEKEVMSVFARDVLVRELSCDLLKERKPNQQVFAWFHRVRLRWLSTWGADTIYELGDFFMFD